jgi:DNA-binding NarL/FixJ family response regulator
LPVRKVTTAPARLLLADDHDAARLSLRRLLDGARDVQVIAEASDGLEALALFMEFQPDLLLVDVNMPNMDGLALTRAVKERSQRTAVVIVTMDASPARSLDVLKAGADACVVKGTSRRALLTVVRHALAGELLLEMSLARHLLGLVEAAPDGWSACFREPLTAVEMQLLRVTAEGRTRAEMLRALKLNSTGLSGGVRSLLRKLGAPVA